MDIRFACLLAFSFLLIAGCSGPSTNVPNMTDTQCIAQKGDVVTPLAQGASPCPLAYMSLIGNISNPTTSKAQFCCLWRSGSMQYRRSFLKNATPGDYVDYTMDDENGTITRIGRTLVNESDISK